MRAIIGQGLGTTRLAFTRGLGLAPFTDSDMADGPGEAVAAISFDPVTDNVAVIKANAIGPAELLIFETRGYTRVTDLTSSLGVTNGTSDGSDEGYYLRYSPDGSKLAVGMPTDPWVQIFDTSDWSLYGTPSTAIAVGGTTITKIGLDWDPTSTFLAVSFTQGTATRFRIYDCTTTTPSQVTTQTGVSSHAGRGIAWSPDGTRLLWGSHPVTLSGNPPSVWETTGWTTVSQPAGYTGNATRCVAWQGNYVLLQGRAVSIFMLVYNTGGSMDPSTWTLTDPSGALPTTARTACLTRGSSDIGLAYSGFDGTMGYVSPPDSAGGAYIFSDVVSGLAYSIDARAVADDSVAPTAKKIAMAVADAPYVVFFNEAGIQSGLTLTPESENSLLAKIYPDGSKILTSHYDSATFETSARVYDMSDGTLLSTLFTAEDPDNINFGSAISPDGTKIALSVYETPGIRFFDAATYAAYSAVDTPIITTGTNYNGLCRWSPDSRYCAVNTLDWWNGKMVRRVYDTLTTSPTLVVAANQDGSTYSTDESGDWSPDGTQFVSGFGDGDDTIKVFDTSDWSEDTPPTAQPIWDEPFNVRWSGNYIYLWSVSYGRAYYYDTGGSSDATTWTLHPMLRLGYDDLVNATLAGTPDVLIQATDSFERTQMFSPPTAHPAYGIPIGSISFGNVYDVSVVEGEASDGDVETEINEALAGTDSLVSHALQMIEDSLAAGESNLGQLVKNFLDAIAMGDTATGRSIYALIERVGVSDAWTTQAAIHSMMAESFSAAERLGAILPALLNEALALGETWQGNLVAIGELLDSLNALDAVTSRLDAVAILALALTIGDALLNLTAAQIAEIVDSSDTAAAQLAANTLLIEMVDATAAVLGGKMALVGLAEGTALVDGVDPVAQMRTLLAEGIDVDVELILFGDVYQGWVVNNDTLAPSEYDNFPFNSMARIGQRYFGASETGLFEFGGDDDAGNPIMARILTGESDFGAPQMKRVERAYMGYSTRGELVLKVIAMLDGQKTEFWYRARPLRAGEVTETRVPIGRGIESRYWQFEWVNVDGADFELDRLDLQVLITSRRI